MDDFVRSQPKWPFNMIRPRPSTAGQWLPPALVVDEVLVREVEGEGDVLVVAVLLVSLVHLLQHRVTVAKSSDGQEQREEE